MSKYKENMIPLIKEQWVAETSDLLECEFAKWVIEVESRSAVREAQNFTYWAVFLGL